MTRILIFLMLLIGTACGPATRQSPPANSDGGREILQNITYRLDRHGNCLAILTYNVHGVYDGITITSVVNGCER